MNQRLFVTSAAAIGVAVPVLWLLVYWAVLRGDSSLTNSIMSGWHFDRVLIVLWPSWLLLIADPEERSIAIPLVAIAINAVLYGGVGWLIWFGLSQRRHVLTGVATVLLAGWYVLLRWYLRG